jgi:hypothetical protein
MVEIFAELSLVFGGGFAGEDDGAGGESVGEGVEGGGLFAGRGWRGRGILRRWRGRRRVCGGRTWCFQPEYRGASAGLIDLGAAKCLAGKGANDKEQW